jgi:hypothetical protein
VIASAAAGPFLAACAVLAFAGAAKVLRPRGARAAASALGLPASAAAVRGLGVVEMAAATAGIAYGGYAGVVVALVYAGLAVVAARLLVRSPGTNCGCLGGSDAPVSVSHVVVDGAAALAALLAATGGSPLGAPGSSLTAHLTFLVATGCCAWLGVQLLDALPALNREVRAGGTR